MQKKLFYHVSEKKRELTEDWIQAAVCFLQHREAKLN